MQLGVGESCLQEARAEASVLLTLNRKRLIPGGVLLTILAAALERTQFPDKGRGSQTDAALGFSSGSHDDDGDKVSVSLTT